MLRAKTLALVPRFDVAFGLGSIEDDGSGERPQFTAALTLTFKADRGIERS